VRAVAPEVALPEVDDDPWGVGVGVVVGPTRLDAPTTSVGVPAGWQARRADGLLWLERVGEDMDARAEEPADWPSARFRGLRASLASTVRTPVGVALWMARFQAIAEEGGATLRRLARSVSIRERLDFSCAVFDPRGDLIATAPHVPVHLGAMGDTVRDLLASGQPAVPGQAWLSNDPRAGGSHLPDLTVVTAVDVPGGVGFVASRGHHVDVGGLTPGSMPPFSRTLADEGAVVRQLPLLDGARLLEAEVREALAASRAIDVVLADHARGHPWRSVLDSKLYGCDVRTRSRPGMQSLENFSVSGSPGKEGRPQTCAAAQV
jgi:5-oxoprolinase (ATP-hydrolysing)